MFPSADECTAIDYTAGVVLAICQDYSEFDASYIGVLDPATGVLTPWDAGQFAGEGYVYFTAIAVDPVTGTVYAFGMDEETGASTLYTVDPEDGITDSVPVSYIAWGADFDRDGQLWITTEVEVGGGEFPPSYSALATVTPSDGSSPFLEIYNEAGTDVTPIFSEGGFFGSAITVWGDPVLPATGPADSQVPLAAAALLLLTGTILAGVTVLRRRKLEA